jgi:hypothetical protein
MNGSLEYGGYEGLITDSVFLQECEAAWRSAKFDPDAHRAYA